MFDDLTPETMAGLTPEEQADLDPYDRQPLYELLAAIAADSSVLAEILLNQMCDYCVAGGAGGDRRRMRKVFEAAGINRQFVAEQLDFYAGRYLKAVEEGREGDHTDADTYRVIFYPTRHIVALLFGARLRSHRGAMNIAAGNPTEHGRPQGP